MNVKRYFNQNKSTVAWVLILFAFRWSFADQYRVPTGSMLPTVQIGDHLLTNKMAYDFKIPFTEFKLVRTNEPERGEVIVFLYPKDESINFVKRVVAVPGDILKIENNKIYINGQRLNENYLNEENKNAYYSHQFEIKIPKDFYFVMGDNRENSLDSRYWGLVPRKNIKGRAMNVLWNVTFENYLPSINIFRTGIKI